MMERIYVGFFLGYESSLLYSILISKHARHSYRSVGQISKLIIYHPAASLTELSVRVHFSFVCKTAACTRPLSQIRLSMVFQITQQ